jgi:hypothetical protein
MWLQQDVHGVFPPPLQQGLNLLWLHLPPAAASETKRK